MLGILNTNDELISILENDGSAAASYWDDEIHEKLNDAYITLTFKMPGDHPAAADVVNGHKVILQDRDGDFQVFRIKTTDDLQGTRGERVKEVYAEHIALELNGTILRPGEYLGLTATQYLDLVLQNTRWKVGIVEWFGFADFILEEHKSGIQAIILGASQFEGEFKFRIEMEHGSIKNLYVDLLERRGADSGVQVLYGHNQESLRRFEDESEIYTALIGVAKGSDGLLTFADVYAEDKPVGQDWIGNDEALQRHGILMPNGERQHYMGVYIYGGANEDLTPYQLLTYTRSQLTKVSKPKFTYEGKVTSLEFVPVSKTANSDYSQEKMRLGDTLGINNVDFQPELIVSARVVEMKWSLSNPARDSVVLGDYRNIFDQSVIAQLNELRNTIIANAGVWEQSGTPVIRSTVAPTDTTAVWIDTSTVPNVIKTFNVETGLWEKASPENVSDIGGLTSEEVQQLAQQTTEDYAEKEWHIGPTPPTETDRKWLDTSVSPYVTKVFVNGIWEKASPTEAADIGAETPAGAQQKAESEADAAETAAKNHADTVSETAKSEAIAAAQADATAKANAAEQAAITAANAETALAETRAKAHADGIVSDEEAARIAQDEATLNAAKTDATAKANAAEQAAISAAALDAEAKANAAEQAAITAANAETALAETRAKAHADGIVSEEEAARIAQDTATLNAAKTDATSKANAAEQAAIDAAALDAQSKANAAKQAAIDAANAETALAETRAKSYADGVVSDEEAARIAQAEANLAAAKSDATAKANAAETAAKNHADLVAEQKKQEAITAAQADATAKANAAQAAAENVARSEAALAEANAEAYADGIVDAEEAARIQQAADNLATAKADATQKASDAEEAAKAHAELVAVKEATEKEFSSQHKEFYNFFSFEQRANNVLGDIYIYTNIPMTSRMYSLDIKGYNYKDYETDIDLTIGFYAYSTPSFLSKSFVNRGNKVISKVQGALDPNGNVVLILTPETGNWFYPAITITRMKVYYQSIPADVEKNWSAEILTAMPTGFTLVTQFPATIAETTEGAADKADQAEQNAKDYAEPEMYQGPNPPTDTTKKWIDTSTVPHLIKYYNTSTGQWVTAAPTIASHVGAETLIHVGTAPPADSTRKWIDISKSPFILKTYQNGAWKAASPTDLADLTGKVLGTQITDGAISTPHINVNGLSAGVIKTGILDADLVQIISAAGGVVIDEKGIFVRSGLIRIDGGLTDADIASSSKWNNQGTYIDETGVYTGEISWNQGYGGTLQLGGINNQNGELTVLDSEGNPKIRLGNDAAGFGEISVDYIRSVRNLVRKTDESDPNFDRELNRYTVYVDGLFGSDQTGDGTKENPFATIQTGIDSIPRYLDYDAQLRVYPTRYDENVVVKGFKGHGAIEIATCAWDVIEVKDYSNGSDKNGSNHWVEIQANDMSQTNVALNKAPYSNGTSTGYPLVNANDGNISSSQYADMAGGDIYVRIPLGGTYDLSHVKVWKYYHDERIYNGIRTYVTQAGRGERLIWDNEAWAGKFQESPNGHRRTLYLNGTIDIINCDRVVLRAMLIDARSYPDAPPLKIQGCPYADVRMVTALANSQQAYCFYGYTSYIRFHDCEGNYARTAVFIAAYGARIDLFEGNYGGDAPRGIYAFGASHIGGYGDTPTGTTVAVYSVYGGIINSAWTGSGYTGARGVYTSRPAEAPPPPPAPKEVVKTFSSVDGQSWRSQSGNWYESNVVQGYWSPYGPYRGYWYFGDTLYNAVRGKDITKIRIYVTRNNSGGYSSSQTAYFRAHGYASQPSSTGQPTYYGTAYASGSFKWGEGKWITLPSSMHAYFESGGCKGIMIYTSSTAATTYMKFSTVAKVEVTYYA